MICPFRLLERSQIFTDCVHLLRLHEPGNELRIVAELAVPGGSIDYCLVSVRDGKPRDFVGIELQTLDTTGTVWPERQRFLHQHKVVHGNITPQNVLFQDRDQTFKLSDVVVNKALAGTRLWDLVVRNKAARELPYLAWDDNHALAVKCIWALHDIGTDAAKEKLALLAGSDLEVIRENASELLAELHARRPGDPRFGGAPARVRPGRRRAPRARRGPRGPGARVVPAARGHAAAERPPRHAL